MSAGRALIGIAPLYLLCVLAGCQEMWYQEQRLEAQRKWVGLRADIKLRLAAEQIENGRISSACETLAEAIALDAADPTPHRIMAECQLELGDLTAAHHAARRAVALGGNSGELAYLQGVIAEHRAGNEEALKHFLEAVRLEPDNTDYASAATECLVSLGRADEAVSLVSGQLQRRPTDGRLRRLRAHVLLLLNQREQAAADFEAAGQLLDSSPSDAGEYGLLLVSLGRYARALAELQPLVERPAESEKVSPAVLRGVAECHIRLGEPNRARQLLREHVRQTPDDGRGWWLLAQSNLSLGDWDAVRDCVERGEQLASRASDWTLLRAYLSWRDGDSDTTASLLESILHQRPDDVVVLGFLAQVHERLADYGRARREYEAVLRLDPEAAWVRARLEAGVGSAGD